MKITGLALGALLCGCDLSENSECNQGHVSTWSWADAQTVSDFNQEDREGNAILDTGWESTVSAYAESPGLRVVGDYLPFMCGEAVEGFYRKDGERVVVLVQPVDMDPDKETGPCFYGVEAGIPENPPAEVSLYERRHGCCDVESEPELVGCVKVKS
jgi:hypothetical protein